jgi:hypothetical protein
VICPAVLYALDPTTGIDKSPGKGSLRVGRSDTQRPRKKLTALPGTPYSEAA